MLNVIGPTRKRLLYSLPISGNRDNRGLLVNLRNYHCHDLLLQVVLGYQPIAT